MGDATFPIVAVLESLLAWQRGPTAAREARIEDALEGLGAAVGARGVRLTAESLGPAPLTIGSGSLAPTAAAAGDEPPNLRRYPLRANTIGPPLGSLLLDSPTGDVQAAVRAVELAVEAAWLREDSRQAAERLEALDAATRGIAGVLALDRVLQLIADRVRELIGAQYAALGIVGNEGLIERFMTSGISQEQRERIGALPRGHGLLGLIIRENRAYRIPHIAGHPSSHGFPPDHPPMTSFLGVPIQVKGRSVGNFYLTNKRNATEFSESDERLVEMFALHAGVAIENARLHELVQQLAVVDERIRIGKDLHDGIIQAIYAVGLSLEDVPDLMHEAPDEAAARVDRAIDALNLTIRDIRNFIFGLRPELVDHVGLVAGLAALLNEFRLNTVIDVEFEPEATTPELDADRRGEMLQIAREALSNIARHSGATRVEVRISREDDHIVLAIADNGRGFDVGADRDGVHQGLQNMRARATDVGGRLDVESETGGGTRIIATLPLAAPPASTAKDRRTS